MSVYQRWVERDLERWRAEGWISEEGASAIRSDLAQRASFQNAQTVFAIIGAALLILAGAAFVAANWDAIPRPGKLTLFLALTWAAYGAAYLFHRRGLETAVHAAALTGVGFFGADIMLIGQMYHMGGAPEDAVLLWALGGLITGALLRSAPVLVLSLGLFTLWAEWSGLGPRPVASWGYFVALLAVSAAFLVVTRWRGAFHLLALGCGWFFFTLGYRALAPGLEPNWFVPTLIGVGVMVAGLIADQRPTLDAKLDHRCRAFVVYGFILAALSLFQLQFFDLWDVKGLASFGPYAALVLGFLIASLWLAITREHDTLLWWALAALFIDLSGLYLRTVGSLLETALFFLLAASLVIGIAVWARQRRPAPMHSGGERAP